MGEDAGPDDLGAAAPAAASCIRRPPRGAAGGNGDTIME